MSIYIEEAVVAIEALQEFCERLLHKFDNGTPAKDLLIETDELVSRIKNLAALLPDGISLGDWGRKTYFMTVWLKKDEPSTSIP